MRIERFVAVHSNPRRTKIEARRLILDGAVTVNGGIVARIGFQVFLGAYSTVRVVQMFFCFLKVFTRTLLETALVLSPPTHQTPTAIAGCWRSLLPHTRTLRPLLED